jgi:DNA (cytosine-5)-methyltransferase 1
VSELVLSCFPGIGLLDMAFEQEGFCVVRGPDCLWGGCIKRFHPPAGKFSGLIGGPPCQSFSSLAHLVRANGYTPIFGNLIPEFERCISEALPAWFLMENVPQAPEPSVPGYGVTSFLLDNSTLCDGTGWGQEQRRVRRFSFGLFGVERPPSLMRWIDLAVFVLPDASSAVVGSLSETTVAIGGSGKLKKSRTVTSNVGGRGSSAKPQEGKAAGGKGRYKLADALRLQGLPEDFFRHAPFTAEGKLKAVANGVAIPTGRAIARAVKEALNAR